MTNFSYDDSAKLAENQTFGAYSNLFDCHIGHDDCQILDSGSADTSIFSFFRFNRPLVINPLSHPACRLSNSRSPPLDNTVITHCVAGRQFTCRNLPNKRHSLRRERWKTNNKRKP